MLEIINCYPDPTIWYWKKIVLQKLLSTEENWLVYYTDKE